MDDETESKAFAAETCSKMLLDDSIRNKWIYDKLFSVIKSMINDNECIISI